MKSKIFKVIAIPLLFLFTLFAGLLPIKIRGSQRKTGTQLMSLLHCFAGGIFFATCLLDMFPMIREEYQEAFELAGIHTDFPVAEFTTCFGFLLILTVEVIVHKFHSAGIDLHTSHQRERQPLLHSSGRDPQSRKTPEHASVYILIFALSLHSLLEGISIGLIADFDQLVQIAGAVTVHKTIMAFSLGIILKENNIGAKTMAKSSVLFSVTGPAGIGIGMAVFHISANLPGKLSSAILQGMANGTFLFVTFFEIFQRELAGNNDQLFKVLAIILGCSAVTVLVNFA